MQNLNLLKVLGAQEKPVMIKRGMSSTYEEWLMSAEYVMSKGNENVILCERGIRSFETYTRNTLDLAAIPVLRKLTHLPIIIDPSHATGKSFLVAPLACPPWPAVQMVCSLRYIMTRNTRCAMGRNPCGQRPLTN